MSSISPGSAGPSPGWYQDPDGVSAERYWNGRQWTEHRRTPAAESPQHVDRASTSYVAAGYVFAVLIPLVGLIMGIVMMTRNRKNDGAGCIVLSLIFGAIWYGALTS